VRGSADFEPPALLVEAFFFGMALESMALEADFATFVAFDFEGALDD
jgi:hypothetical protein